MPSGLRYCINSASLRFEPSNNAKSDHSSWWNFCLTYSRLFSFLWHSS
jgi:hypothetical protein